MTTSHQLALLPLTWNNDHINIVQGKVEGLPAHLQDRIASTEQLGPILLVFAISCTRARELFNRRPTKEQLRRLTELLGEEPSWFEDRWTKEEFEYYSNVFQLIVQSSIGEGSVLHCPSLRCLKKLPWRRLRKMGKSSSWFATLQCRADKFYWQISKIKRNGC